MYIHTHIYMYTGLPVCDIKEDVHIYTQIHTHIHVYTGRPECAIKAST